MEKIRDYFNFAVRSLTKRKLRSWLTILGIVIGIAAVVSLISIGQGMEMAITEQFEEMGTNKIMIMPGGETSGMMPSMDITDKLTDDDVDVVERVGGIDMVAPMLTKTAAVEFKDEVKYTMVSGLPIDDTMEMMQEMQSIDVIRGRMLKDTDTYKALVGYLFTDDFFDNPVHARNNIKINGVTFKVVGILDRIGNRADDTGVMINLDIAREVLDEPEEITMIIAQTKPGLEPSEVAEDVEKELRRFRGEEEGKETFYVMTAEDMIKSFTQILSIIQLVLVGIAGISLFVGGVGIMNTMYTSVTERTKEIGVMKAIGARNNDILLIFLIESGLVGLLGGGIGCTIGALLAKGVEIAGAESGIPLLKAAITPELFLGVLGFSFFLGVLSGVLPARQASKLKPVDALRHE